MLKHHRFMWRAYVAFIVLSGCGSTANPRSCLDGTCTTEEFPFCDVNGTFGEEPETCIAVTCEPMTFAQCRDDVAITCNATGNDYDLLDCPLGCQDNLGCRSCEPNQTVCANGAVQTCDASGSVTSSEACALGCFESEPRCRNIEPSNGLAQYADAIPQPPDLDLSAGGTINVDTGAVMVGLDPVIASSVLVNRPAGGVPIRLFVVRNARIGDVGVYANQSTALNNQPALAIVATGNISIEGAFRLNGVGSVSNAACDGEVGIAASSQPYRLTGSGGGGHATAGAPGGALSGFSSAPDAGSANGTATLIPLRGGCSSGGNATGGGAIQLSARGKLVVSGMIDAMGSSGQAEQGSVAGGGAGGGILLEASSVELTGSGKLLGTGGAGASPERNGGYSETGDPPLGGTCSVSAYCGAGGDGATNTTPATPGTSIPFVTAADYIGSGGGGGGLGRIRINTPTTTYSTASTSTVVGDVTSGPLSTR